MSEWQDVQVFMTNQRRIERRSDAGVRLATIDWFDGIAPFYAWAAMPNTPELLHRVDAFDTLDGAKRATLDVNDGKLDVSRRASLVNKGR